MNYRRIYMCIVSSAHKEMELGLRPKNHNQKKKFPNQYFEFHHILPKSIFPNWKNRKSNLVALTAREHFFCHQLLTKIYPNSFEMKSAIWRMACRVKGLKIPSKQYEKIRKDFSKGLSEKKKGIQTKASLGKHFYTNGSTNVLAFECPSGFVKGRYLGGKRKLITNELGKLEFTYRKYPNLSRKEIIKKVVKYRKSSGKGWKLSEESRKRISEGHKGSKNGNFGKVGNQKGKKWFNNGFKNILAFEKPDGFVEGKIVKNPNIHYSNDLWICLETKEKHTLKEWRSLGFPTSNMSTQGTSKGFHFKKFV